MLTPGIPGNPAIAMVFSVLLIQGVTPGPVLPKDHPNLFWAVIASMYFAKVMLLVLNFRLVGLWVQMLKVPCSILAPCIVLIWAIGVYSMKNNIDVVVRMVLFGVVGYILPTLQLELGPILPAFVPGRILERSLRQALLISRGDVTIFLTKPISAALVGTAAGMIRGTAVVSLYRTLAATRSVRR